MDLKKCSLICKNDWHWFKVKYSMWSITSEVDSAFYMFVSFIFIFTYPAVYTHQVFWILRGIEGSITLYFKRCTGLHITFKMYSSCVNSEAVFCILDDLFTTKSYVQYSLMYSTFRAARLRCSKGSCRRQTALPSPSTSSPSVSFWGVIWILRGNLILYRCSRKHAARGVEWQAQ